MQSLEGMLLCCFVAVECGACGLGCSHISHVSSPLSGPELEESLADTAELVGAVRRKSEERRRLLGDGDAAGGPATVFPPERGGWSFSQGGEREGEAPAAGSAGGAGEQEASSAAGSSATAMAR